MILPEYHLRKECVCRRCGWKWRLRKIGRPPQCPGCHSSYWDRERIMLDRRKASA